jgi:hypothetical protein
MMLAVLVLLSLAAILLTGYGLIAYGASSDGSFARFRMANGGHPPSPSPSSAAAGAELANGQPADTVASPEPVSGGVRPVEVTPGPRGGPSVAGTQTAASGTEAHPGRPCQPEGGTARDRTGALLRCEARPAGRQPRWRRTS